MGNVKNLIVDIQLPDREHYYNKLWCDLCENLHIHLRNIRIEFSLNEWKEFICHLFAVLKEVNKHKDYKEMSGEQLSLYTNLNVIGKDSKYYPNRFRIEDEHDGSVHIHYRDIRIHLSRKEYNQIASVMKPIGD